jgi:hypothetical protein
VNTAIAPLLQSKRRAGRVAELWSFGHFPSASLPINCCKQAFQPRTPATKNSNGVQSPRLEMQTARHIHLWRAVTLWLAAGRGVLSVYSEASQIASASPFSIIFFVDPLPANDLSSSNLVAAFAPKPHR